MAIIIDLIIICVPLYFLFNFLFTLRGFRKNSRKLKEWSQFNRQMLEWSHEIKDDGVRQEYLVFCADNLIKGDINKVTTVNIVSLKEEIVRKYSTHIPSLKSELRANKLKQILK